MESAIICVMRIARLSTRREVAAQMCVDSRLRCISNVEVVCKSDSDSKARNSAVYAKECIQNNHGVMLQQWQLLRASDKNSR